jgi:tetratricopeptide (TPR) repeat protein
MKKLILLLLFIPLVSFGQKSNDADALKLCVALQSNNFTTDAEAEDAVNKILSVIGASQKPVLQACSNINNAVAAVYKGQRYILYDRDFMNSLTAGSNQYWSNMFILAHEVGHHINGHSLDIVLYASDIIDPKSLEERRKQELEADEFAGFVMAKLGATLKQTSLVMRDIPSISNENDSTHPSKEKRISSVRVGFKKGGSNTTLKKKNNISEKESIVYKGPAKLQNAKDYLNRGIYNQDFTEVYLKRASLKQELEDLNGALDDYNKAIESKFVWYLFWIDYVDVTTYYKRGVVKNLLKDHKGAIEDFNKAIDIDPNYILAYLERGNTKFKLAQLFSSIHDIITEIKPSWFNRDSELTDEEFWSIQETIAAEISQASDAERSDIKVLKTVLRETYKELLRIGIES